MICEQCGKHHDGKYASGRFCCESCARRLVALNQSEEAKLRKISKLLKGNNFIRHYDKKAEEAERQEKKRLLKLKSEVNKHIKVYNYFIDKYNNGWGLERLRELLIHLEYKIYKCEKCNNSIWMNKPIPIEIHHKNGDNKDNSLSNLEFLCPNCHSLTDNFRAKGKRIYHEVTNCQIVSANKFINSILIFDNILLK